MTAELVPLVPGLDPGIEDPIDAEAAREALTEAHGNITEAAEEIEERERSAAQAGLF